MEPSIDNHLCDFDDEENAKDNAYNHVVLFVQDILKQFVAEMPLDVQRHFNNDQSGDEERSVLFQSTEELEAGVHVDMSEHV